MKKLYKTITSVTITTTAALIGLATKAQAFTLSGTGLTTSQGDLAMNADVARNLFGVDGTGVTIGVISDSFDNLGGAASDLLNGDLPSGIQVLKDFPEGGSDEGRGIMQLIHDVAPGANFAFHTGVESQAEYANAILNLADAGADIIVADVFNPFEPFFQDGIPAQSIDNVVSNSDVSFFVAAGNEDRRGYESAFNSSGIINEFFGGEFHDFDQGTEVDIFQNITLEPGNGFGLSFQWDEPFASVSGTGSENDLDIFLFDSSGTNVLAGSVEDNLGGDAVEVFSFFNDTNESEFNLAISNKTGSNPELMKYIVGGGGRDFQINEFYDDSIGTIFGSANAQGAMAVGAASYLQTPRFGTDPAILRPFSSAGGTPILFDAAGNRLPNPEIRHNPGIVAPDGGNTTFFGIDIPEDPDDFPNFPGTSASAPHAAAVAALMLEANPNLDTATIYSILQETALDMDDPDTPGFDQRFDFATGYGLIDAVAAINAVETLNTSTKSIPETSSALGILAFGTLGAGFIVKRNHKKQQSDD